MVDTETNLRTSRIKTEKHATLREDHQNPYKPNNLTTELCKYHKEIT